MHAAESEREARCPPSPAEELFCAPIESLSVTVARARRGFDVLGGAYLMLCRARSGIRHETDD